MPMSNIAREKLESELLLSEGGGIYYDAARVDPDENIATLFIGLGGTGADTLIRIKNDVNRRMVLPKDENGRVISDRPRNIEFLVIDTDICTMRKSYGAASFDRYGSEYCSISVDCLPAVINAKRTLATNKDPVWDWLEDFDATAVGSGFGAGGIRQLG